MDLFAHETTTYAGTGVDLFYTYKPGVGVEFADKRWNMGGDWERPGFYHTQSLLYLNQKRMVSSSGGASCLLSRGMQQRVVIV